MAQKQQGAYQPRLLLLLTVADYPIIFRPLDLQQQYTTYKNNLQQLAQRIGEVEQETEEHK